MMATNPKIENSRIARDSGIAKTLFR